MNAIQSGDVRNAVASWRKSFKQYWKRNQSQDVKPQILPMYHTDATRWRCGCEAFLVSRFLFCKHIVCFFEKPQDPIKFFGIISRQGSCPFWTEEQLVLRTEFRALESNHTTSISEESNVNSNSDSDLDSNSDSYEDFEDEAPKTYDYPEFRCQ